MADILSIEIIFRSGPTLKVYASEIYDLMIDSTPVTEIDFSPPWKQSKKSKSVSFKIKECENRKIWSYTHKTTMDYFDWILYSANITSIRINLQNYRKRTFSVPWKSDSLDDNEYQYGKILDNGDLSISIEEECRIAA